MGIPEDDYRTAVDGIRESRSKRVGTGRDKTRGPGDSVDARDVPNGITTDGAARGYDGRSAKEYGDSDESSTRTPQDGGGIARGVPDKDRQATNHTGRNSYESGISDTSATQGQYAPERIAALDREHPGVVDAIAREQERRRVQAEQFGIELANEPDADDLPEPPPQERMPRGGYKQSRKGPRVDSVTGSVGAMPPPSPTTQTATKSAAYKSKEQQQRQQPKDNILRFPFRLGVRAAAVPLSDSEVVKYHDDVVSALTECCVLADKVITHTNRAHTPAYIWQELEPREIVKIADILLRTGKRSAATASFVRAMVQNFDKLQLGLITGSRFMATLKHYADNGGVYLGFIIPGPSIKHK